jgi:hypothetical protein
VRGSSRLGEYFGLPSNNEIYYDPVTNTYFTPDSLYGLEGEQAIVEVKDVWSGYYSLQGNVMAGANYAAAQGQPFYLIVSPQTPIGPGLYNAINQLGGQIWVLNPETQTAVREIWGF